MSLVTATALAAILSKPSKDRLEFEIRSVCGWLRDNVKYFKKITDEVLQTLVKECSVEKVEQNQIVIWEGEEGDRMYILLSGTMQIYRLNEVDKDLLLESTDDKVTELFTEKIRMMTTIEDPTVLGQCLATLEPGKIFGEVALIEKCTRSASVLAAEDCEMVVIPRELYNNTVAYVLEEEFRMKLGFVESVSFFSCCSQKHKKQLLMAMESHSCDYPTQIIRQGEAAKSMTFLMSGEVRISCDPHVHPEQYEKVIHSWKRESKADSHHLTLRSSKGSQKHKSLDICLLSPSKLDSGNKPCMGDLELLLNMPTAFSSATATSHCVLLTLHSRHFERILLKRNPKSVEIMMKIVHKRVQYWCSRLSSSVSLFPIIKERIRHLMELSIGFKSPPTLYEMSNMKKENIYKYNPPTKGALVDPFGPGTVFYYIKNQYKLREQTKEYNDSKNLQQINLRKVVSMNLDRHSNGALYRPDNEDISRIRFFSKDIGYTTYYDNHVKDLEVRIQDFLKVLGTEGTNYKLPIVEPLSDIVEKIPNMKYPKRGNLVVLKPSARNTAFLRDSNLSPEESVKMLLDMKK